MRRLDARRRARPRAHGGRESSTRPPPAAVPARLTGGVSARLLCMNLPTCSGSDVVAASTTTPATPLRQRRRTPCSSRASRSTAPDATAGLPIDLAALRKAFVAAMVAGHAVPVVFTAGRVMSASRTSLHILANESRARSRRARLPRAACQSTSRPDCLHRPRLQGHARRRARAPRLRPHPAGSLDTHTHLSPRPTESRRATHIVKLEGRGRTSSRWPPTPATSWRWPRDDVQVNEVLHDPALAARSPRDRRTRFEPRHRRRRGRAHQTKLAHALPSSPRRTRRWRSAAHTTTHPERHGRA
jgi:hypothetical protein